MDQFRKAGVQRHSSAVKNFVATQRIASPPRFVPKPGQFVLQPRAQTRIRSLTKEQFAAMGGIKGQVSMAGMHPTARIRSVSPQNKAAFSRNIRSVRQAVRRNRVGPENPTPAIELLTDRERPPSINNSEIFHKRPERPAHTQSMGTFIRKRELIPVAPANSTLTPAKLRQTKQESVDHAVFPETSPQVENPPVLPIELYDAEGYDEHPIDIIPMENQDAYSKWFDTNGSYIWLKCQILEYNEKDNRYLIVFEHGVQKQVGRLNLRFKKLDSPDRFKRRITNAETNRKKAEQIMQFNCAISNMPNEGNAPTITVIKFILYYLNGKSLNVTEKNYRDPLLYRSQTSRVRHNPSIFTWKSSRTHFVQENFIYHGFQNYSDMRQAYINSIAPAHIRGWEPVHADTLRELILEIDQGFDRAMRVSKFILSMPYEPSSQAKYQDIFNKTTVHQDYGYVIPVVEENFTSKLKRMQNKLHQGNSTHLKILFSLNEALSEFESVLFVPIQFEGSSRLERIDRQFRVAWCDAQKELTQIMFDKEYEISRLVEKQYTLMKNRNSAKLAKKTFETQEIQLETEIPSKITDRLFRFLSLCNRRFDKAVRVQFDASLAHLRDQLESIIHQSKSLFDLDLDEPLNADQIVNLFYSGGFPDNNRRAPTYRCTLVANEVKRRQFEISLSPSPEEWMQSIMEYVDYLTEEMQNISPLISSRLPDFRQSQLLRVVNCYEDEYVLAWESIEQVLTRLNLLPEGFLKIVQGYSGILGLNASRLHEQYSQEIPYETFEEKCKSLNTTREELNMYLYPQKRINFGLYLINIETVKNQLLDNINKCFNTLMLVLIEKMEALIQWIADQEIEIIEIIGHEPENLEELSEMKTFIIQQYPERVTFIVKNAELLSQYLGLSEECQHTLDLSFLETIVYVYGTICRLNKTKRRNEREIRRCEKIFAKELVRDQEGMFEELDGIQDEFLSLKKECDIEKYDDISFSFGVLKQKIRDAIDRSTTINTREEIVGARQTNYGQINSIKKEFNPYCKLWFFVKDFRKNLPRWMKGPFKELNRDSIREEIEMYEVELIKLEQRAMKKSKSGLKLVRDFSAEVAAFKPYLPLIISLRNPGFKDRHWDELTIRLETKLTRHLDTTLEELLEKGILEKVYIIQELSQKASRELALENAKVTMEHEWDDINLTVVPYKDTGSYILIEMEEIWDLLDDHIIKTASISASPFVKFMEKEITQWKNGLVKTQDILEEWENTQRLWQYLRPIFAYRDISLRLPDAASRFKQINSTWETIMVTASGQTHVLDLCLATGTLHDSLIFCNDNLQSILRSLNEYLNVKRQSFPRFYFLSNDELISILSHSTDIKSVQKYMIKCFEGIKSLKLNKKGELKGMCSPEGETVKFGQTIHTKFAGSTRNVEEWMLDVENQMKTILKTLTNNCFVCYLEEERLKWLLEWPSQIVHLISNVMWTGSVETAMMSKSVIGIIAHASSKVRKVTEHGKNHLYTLYSKLTAQLNKIVETVRQDLSKLDRLTLSTLVVIDVHNKDVVEKLIEQNVSDVGSFDWMSQLRYYLKDRSIDVQLLDINRSYGYEYLGNQRRLIMTSLTDRCYRTLMGAVKLSLGGAPEGPAGTGKTESCKDLAKAMGKKCVVFNCSDRLDHVGMAKFFTGLASCGAWACFDEFNRIDLEVLSVIAEQILQIQVAQHRRSLSIDFDGSVVSMDWTCAIFITMNPGYAGRSELPDNLKSLFRPVAMMVPDYTAIAEIYLYSLGFINARSLSIKVYISLRLASEQLSSQSHYDYGLRTVVSIIQAAGVLRRNNLEENEDVLILKAINDSSLSKFIKEDIPLFQGITSDLIPNVSASVDDYGDLASRVISVFEKNHMEPNAFLQDKIRQIYASMQIRHGIMLVGKTLSCKSTAIDVLKQSLIALKGPDQVQTYIFNPKSVTLSQLYGTMDPISHDWTDGLLSLRVRECAEREGDELQWIIFDGPVDSLWIESMNTVLDDNKKLCLTSGEIIKLTQYMTMLFEVEMLNEASPATVSRCGIIYMEEEDWLRWKSLVFQWLQDIPAAYKTENFKNLLEEYFAYFLDPVVEWFQSNPNLKISIDYSMNWIVRNFLNVFESLLLGDLTRDQMALQVKNEVLYAEKTKQEITTQKLADGALTGAPLGLAGLGVLIYKHMSKQRKEQDDVLPANSDIKQQDKTDLFCWLMEALTFSFGAILDQAYQVPFSELLDNLFLSAIGKVEGVSGLDTLDKLNHIYHHQSAFQVHYKGGGRWVEWSKTLQPVSSFSIHNINSILIPTEDTARQTFALEKLVSKGYNVLFAGVTGTGKTVTIRKFLGQLPTSYFSTIFVMLSAQSSCNETQDLIDSKLHKRFKGVFGPEMGKRCVIFVDDFNMPEKEHYGAQPPLEILRQAIDQKGWFNRETCQYKQLQDCNMLAAMNPPGGGRNTVPNRLMTKFTLFVANEFSNEILQSIFTQMMDLGLSFHPKPVKLSSKTIAAATIMLYKEVCQYLPPTPAKFIYTFNLRDISNVFRGILSSPPLHLTNVDILYRLWMHECSRVFEDRMINDSDKSQFREIVNNVLTSVLNSSFEKLCPSGDPIFCGFLTGMQYQATTLKTIKDSLEMYLDDYNTREEPNKKLNFVLFDFAVLHVVRIARILQYPYGNALLIGVGGSGRQYLAKLASIALEYQILSIEISKSYGIENWKEDIKEFIIKAGSEEVKCTLIIEDTQIKSEVFLENLNSLINSGEVPNLFNHEERAQLLQDISSKRGMSIQSELQRWESFNQLIRSNLHMVLWMSPIGDSLRNRIRKFPSLLTCCTIDWLTIWPVDALTSVSKHFFKSHSMCDSKEIEDAAVGICCHFHLSTRDFSEKYLEEQQRYNYVTPSNLLQLLEMIKVLMAYKEETSVKLSLKYSRGVTKLDEAKGVVSRLREEIQSLQPVLQEKTEQITKTVSVVQKEEDAAKKQREVVMLQQKLATKDASAAKEMKADWEEVLSRAIPELEAAVAALKTLKKKEIDEVKSMKKPPAPIRLTVEAVAILTGEKPVRVKVGNLGFKDDYYEAGKKLMMNPHFLRNLIEFDRESITSLIMIQLEPYINDPKFTPEIVKNSSKATMGLCQWVLAMVNFYNINEAIKPRRQMLNTATTLLDNRYLELKSKQEKLQAAEDELAEWTKKLDDERNELTRTKDEIKLCEVKLERAEALTQGLSVEGERWTKQVERLENEMINMFGDVMISAGVISYCSSFIGKYRDDLVSKSWIPYIQETCIPCSDEATLSTVISQPLKIQKWIINKLPNDKTSIENALIIRNSNRWPLIIDPQAQANRWIRSSSASKTMVTAKMTDANFLTVLESAIFTGAILLLENVGEELDPILDPILEKQVIQQEGINFIKLGDSLKQFDPRFKLFLTSNLPNPHFLPEITCKVTIVNFTITQEGLTEQFKTMLCEIERPLESDQKKRITIQAAEYSKNLQKTEDDILQVLQTTQGNLLDDEIVIQILTDCKEVSEEVETKLKAAQEAEKKISDIQEQYISVAFHGAILFFTVADLPNIDPMYEFSLEWIFNLYKQAISDATKALNVSERCENLIETFRKLLFTRVSSSLFEKDKILFVFLLLIRILESQGQLVQEEWRFLMSGVTSEVKESISKPQGFDAQIWNHVCALSGIQIFENLPQQIQDDPQKWIDFVYSIRRPTEIQYFEELTASLPTPYNDSSIYTRMQRLLIFKVLTPELLIPAIRSFIKSELGHEYIDQTPFSIEQRFEETTSSIPIIFILSPGNDPFSTVKKFATEQKKQLQVVSLGKGQGTKAEGIIQQVAQTGGWILLQN